ncbi:uncharacterized protein LOC113328322 isoform X2 [Papaver somniferum]|uniref:uncharacterized protein LOC113328322 isoform X2 n=1 Tax=Papaver somniferum TaxID=3469 RepID=UPI000E6F8D3D|nr:uncharacterized protein LOC113328322 isoform X2 [Papaver somniferum]
MASLPEDIIMDVLLKSSVKSISRFKCVGKHWLSSETSISSVRCLPLNGSTGNLEIRFKITARSTLRPEGRTTGSLISVDSSASRNSKVII